MTADAALIGVIDALERLATPYVLVGSLATNFHGIPRSTRVADIVVAIEASTLDRLAAALMPGLRIQPQTSFETVTGTIRHVIEVQDSPFIIELFGWSDDPHDQARLERVRDAPPLPLTVLRSVRRRPSPDDREIILLDMFIDAHQAHAFGSRLGHKQSAEGITVVRRQVVHGLRMLPGHGQLHEAFRTRADGPAICG